MMKTNIVLIGFMGCGKSAAGSALSARTGQCLVDTDAEIERKAGKKIPQIFADFGESYFRTLEAEVAAETAKRSGLVVSTGGGMVKNPENMRLLRETGVVFFLRATTETIYENTRAGGRPLLETENPMETIRALLAERQPLYESAADFIIENNRKPLDELVQEILAAAPIIQKRAQENIQEEA